MKNIHIDMINTGWYGDPNEYLKKEIMKRNEIKVKHPEFGHVIFHGITPRQRDVLENFSDNCTLTNDVVAQNKMLGDMLINQNEEIEKLKEEIKKLKNSGENPYIDYLT